MDQLISSSSAYEFLKILCYLFLCTIIRPFIVQMFLISNIVFIIYIYQVFEETAIL